MPNHNEWRFFLKEPKNRLICLISLAALCATLIGFLFFLRYNETRTGHPLNDKLLVYFHAVDLSNVTFPLTYLSIAAGVLIAARSPISILILLHAYTLLILFRIATLALVPLEPPAGIIPLRDFILSSSVYSGGNDLKDLFFSGHTATISLFVFAFRARALKLLFGLGAAAVGVLLIAQHVHYSIDILAAPFFAWLAIAVAQKISASTAEKRF